MKWLTSCLLTRQRMQCRQKRKVRGRLREAEVFFPLVEHVAVNHVIIWSGLIQNRPGSRSCRRHLRLSVNEGVNIVCVDNVGFNSEEYCIT